MVRSTLYIILICLTSFCWVGKLFAQQEVIYFNKNWIEEYSPERAEYYRIVTFDLNNKPFGMVKDYYITGELQWQGYLSYYDRYNDANSLKEGKCTWYYKNGERSQEGYFTDGKENGMMTFWDEYGNKLRTVEYSMGLIDGKLIEYHENGKPKIIIEFDNGSVVDKWSLVCNEDEECVKVFYETFTNNNNLDLVEKSNCKSKIIENEGLSMETLSDEGFAQFMKLDFDDSQDFTIEYTIELKHGNKDSWQGLIWDFKDKDNYYYYYYTGSGYYCIGAWVTGENYNITEITQSSIVNTGNSTNNFKIIKNEDKIYFYSNDEVVASEEYFPLDGSQIAFHILNGEKELIIKELIVYGTPLDENPITRSNKIDKGNNLPTSKNIDWKGNGSGIIIDTRGYIATCAHVVSTADVIEVDIPEGGITRSYNAKVVKIDNENDLAIIKIADNRFKQLPGLKYNFYTKVLDVGSGVFTLGYPMALTYMGEEVKFTDGKISSKSGYLGDISWYQVTVPSQPGNSGGPLFDNNGNLVGIINSKVMQADNVTYAIKASYLKSMVEDYEVKLNLPDDQSILTELLTDKIKVLSNYVVLIKIK